MAGLAWGAVLSGCVVSVPPGFDTASGDTDASDTTDTTSGSNGPSMRVLVLDQGGAADVVAPILEAAGHDVVIGPNYKQWDGTNPSFSGDTIVLLQVSPSASAVPSACDAALVAFYEGGGGIVRTGLAPLVADQNPGAAIDADPLVEWRDGTDAGLDWWVVERGHELVTDVPERWSEPGTFGYVAASEDPLVQTIMLAKPGDWPVLVGRVSRAKGRMVYINNDFGANGGAVSSQIEGLLSNAVVWAGSR
jgi:hypothetical protein